MKILLVKNSLHGISFSEIFVDTLSLPFVNYIFASANKEESGKFYKKFE